MKLIELDYHTKVVKYFGITLTVPSHTNWLATDGSGNLYAYTAKPTNIKPKSYWSSIEEYTLIGKLDLEGMDWYATLREVS